MFSFPNAGWIPGEGILDRPCSQHIWSHTCPTGQQVMTTVQHSFKPACACCSPHFGPQLLLLWELLPSRQPHRQTKAISCSVSQASPLSWHRYCDHAAQQDFVFHHSHSAFHCYNYLQPPTPSHSCSSSFHQEVAINGKCLKTFKHSPLPLDNWPATLRGMARTFYRASLLNSTPSPSSTHFLSLSLSLTTWNFRTFPPK